MLLGKIDVHAAREAFGADMREFALLWLVFAVLDVFVVDRLTLRWFMSNLFSALFFGESAHILNSGHQQEPTNVDRIWMAFLTAVAFASFLTAGGFYMIHLEEKERDRLRKSGRI